MKNLTNNSSSNWTTLLDRNELAKLREVDSENEELDISPAAMDAMIFRTVFGTDQNSEFSISEVDFF